MRFGAGSFFRSTGGATCGNSVGNGDGAGTLVEGAVGVGTSVVVVELEGVAVVAALGLDTSGVVVGCYVVGFEGCSGNVGAVAVSLFEGVGVVFAVST